MVPGGVLVSTGSLMSRKRVEDSRSPPKKTGKQVIANNNTQLVAA